MLRYVSIFFLCLITQYFIDAIALDDVPEKFWKVARRVDALLDERLEHGDGDTAALYIILLQMLELKKQKLHCDELAESNQDLNTKLQEALEMNRRNETRIKVLRRFVTGFGVDLDAEVAAELSAFE